MEGQLKAGTILTFVKAKPCKVLSLLGAGGQGEVYEIEFEGKRHALKWYYKHMATTSQRRILNNLISMGAQDTTFLWPQDIVEDAETGVFGYCKINMV